MQRCLVGSDWPFDERSDSLPPFDQPGLFERRHGGPQGHSRHAELTCEFVLAGQASARTIASRRNPIAQDKEYLVMQRHARATPYAYGLQLAVHLLSGADFGM